MARPSKCTREITEQICAFLEKGNTRRASAALVDIDEVTFSRWYHRGAREDRGIYRDFHLAVNRAEAKHQDTAIEMIRAGCATNPKIALQVLGRRYPGEWGRRDNVEEKSVEDQAAAQQQLRELLIERFEKLLPEEDETDPPADMTPAAEAPSV